MNKDLEKAMDKDLRILVAGIIVLFVLFVIVGGIGIYITLS
jgi:hypothetical protein